MTVDVPVSQAYQLIIGRVIACEDRQELIERDQHDIIVKLANIEELWRRQLKYRVVTNNRMDELWDAVVAAYEKMQWEPPAEKSRVSYTAQNGPNEPLDGAGHDW